MTVKLGPITASFNGEARFTRDDARRRGAIVGAGSDRFTRSRAAAEIAYGLAALPENGGTRVDIEVRALLTGPLAQFSRGGIVEDLAARLTHMFADNLERLMSGAALATAQHGPQASALRAGSLLGAVLMSRLRSWLAWLFGTRSR
jgi:carbon-monoxide dehydrogenase small subunit